MKKTAYTLPLLLALAGGAQAQGQVKPVGDDACPQLSAESGLTWQHKSTATTEFCNAMRGDGSEAFGLYIAGQSAFKPSRINRVEPGSIDGHAIHWYRSEIASKPDIEARETVVELRDGRVAHLWVQASTEQLEEALKQAQSIHFQAKGRLTSSN